ncbi:MAG TPA: DUF4235 domain-containing protein [Jatrophihabitans sp.]|nr:DUF4235 domain-containing protein [Jatrophihabitans sp.]
MAGGASRIAFKVIAAAVAIPVGRLVTKTTTKAWATARPDNPPVDPKDMDTNWGDALIWAGLTGIGAAVAQLLASKGADTVWRALTGKPTPKPKVKTS